MPSKLFGPMDHGVFADSYASTSKNPKVSCTEPRKSRKTTSSTSPVAPPIESRRSSVTHSSQAVPTLQLRNDRLGALARELTSAMSNSPSWESLVSDFRGRPYLARELDDLDHPAAELLRDWRDEGVPANSDSPPWTTDMKDRCIHRGCHKSAKEHAEFLREELSEFIESKYWVVLPYRLVRHLQNLMLSPAAVKEERERKPRLLCDHSWPWEGWTSVNESTIAHAPPEAMQFGRALPRILKDIRHANPRFGPPLLAKHDVKDGFYRLLLRAQDCPRLALVLPKFDDEEALVAIPLACAMGWVESPPTFCTMSETVCDCD